MAKKAAWTEEERALVQCFGDVARNYFESCATPPTYLRREEAKERITIHIDFALERAQNKAMAPNHYHIAYAETYLTAFGL